MGDTGRRRFLQLLAGLPLVGLSDLLVVRAGTVSASAEILDYFDRQITDLIDGYERRPIAQTAVRIRRELPTIRSLLTEGAYRGDQARRLRRTAGRLTALQAATRTDLNDTPAAVNLFSEAFRLADSAGDRPLQAWIRCWQSSIARKGGDPKRALALADNATRWVGTAHPVAARAAVVGAWAQAALGNRWEVHARVGQAWTIVGDLDRDAHGEPGFSVDTMHTTSIGEMSAAVYVEAGFPDMAGVYTEAVQMSLDLAGATGRRSLIRVSAASAAIQRGDVEHAVALVHNAMDISADRPSARLHERIAAFTATTRTDLGAMSELDELEERLRTWRTPSI
ncbi:hypothetical protein [Parafrankia sp. FMc2]|uniref:hypothetical protein n=1 Tax=Parafrankia sp. FMc2 TaxID=3233196 RepID=UPI0034D598D5